MTDNTAATTDTAAGGLSLTQTWDAGDIEITLNVVASSASTMRVLYRLGLTAGPIAAINQLVDDLSAAASSRTDR